MSEKSTRANVRNGEFFLPGLGVHETFESWRGAGRPAVIDEAGQRAAELLSAHEPLPLGDDVERELAKLLPRARKRQEDAG